MYCAAPRDVLCTFPAALSNYIIIGIVIPKDKYFFDSIKIALRQSEVIDG